MTFFCLNSITVEYVELLLTGLKATYIIAPSLLRFTILNPTMKRLLVVYRKDQRLVRSYFYCVLMICQIVPRNYHFESLLMKIQICFTQMISLIMLKQS